MSKRIGSLLKAAVKKQNGQVLPWMALLMVLFLGMAGLTLDLGHAYVCYRELQASTDAAALAGAYEMAQTGATTALVNAAVSADSSVAGGKNVNINLPSANVTVTPTLKCTVTATNLGVPCAGTPTGDNTIQVVQSAIIPTYFIRALVAFGVHGAGTMTLNAESTAAMQGSTNAPYNIAVIVDTTGSMGSQDTDASCNNTRISCALAGVQTLLGSLSPCTIASIKTTCVGFDQVSLFTFPNVQANDVSDDTTCPTKDPPIPAYTTPPIPAAGTTTYTAPTGTAGTYQITGYLDNFSSTNASGGALNTSSALVVATGDSATRNCGGLATPGGDGTYLAGSIYQAQTTLMAEQAANPGTLNAMVILTDGASNTTLMSGTLTKTGVYPSLIDQCQQSVTAAQYASSLGTTVYTVAYGASNQGNKSQCTTDATLSPCTELQEMATTPADFYSDSTASQNKGQCTSASNPNLSLTGIFNQIKLKFTVPKLIQNGAT
jgi:hypothetical protein